jgi:hypothetical protein
MEHHSKVGIRATLACVNTPQEIDKLVERNWDLAVNGDEQQAAATAASLRERDGRDTRGWVSPMADALDSQSRLLGGRNDFVLYRVALKEGVITQPQPLLDRPLPAQWLPSTLNEAMRAIDVVVMASHWAIWLVDAHRLDCLEAAQHQRLLHWLGEHHARIWCAPIRDVATWVDR